MRQMSGALRLVLLLAALPVAAFSTACGSDTKKVEAEEWVEALCEAAADFDEATDEIGDKFAEVSLDDTAAAKDDTADLLKEQKDAAKDFRADFGKIGQPDIDGGAKVIDAFEDQFKENDDRIGEMSDRVADIDEDADFMEAFMEIADDIGEPDFRSKLEDVADDHDEVEDLIALIDDDPDCAAIIFDEDEAASNTDTPPTTRTPITTAPAKTTNEKWVAGICTALTGWVGDLEDANTALQSDTEKAASAKDLKALLVDFLKDGRAETVNMRKEIAALKAPDVKDGAAIHKVFVDVSDDLVKVFDGLVTDAEKLDTSSLQKVADQLDVFVGRVESSFDEVGEYFDKLDQYDPGELDQLFQTRPECQGF
ncbi:MAG TPA: hypothetical protein PL082_07395 [Tepidiformaceae bacterium]|nr:hypothetical protein [Tepidiformaceae bacterium]